MLLRLNYWLWRLLFMLRYRSFFFCGSICAKDATKTDMAHSGIDHLRLACRGTVSQAVVRCAEVRTALDHSAGNADVGLARVVALLLRSNTWVNRRTATGMNDFV